MAKRAWRIQGEDNAILTVVEQTVKTLVFHVSQDGKYMDITLGITAKRELREVINSLFSSQEGNV